MHATRTTGLHAHLHVYIDHTLRHISSTTCPLGSLLTLTRRFCAPCKSSPSNHTSTTKLFPQTGHRRVASSRSCTNEPSSAASRSLSPDALDGCSGTACVSPTRAWSPSLPPLGSGVGAAAAGPFGAIDAEGGRSALRLHPTQVRTAGVASRNEVTQQRAVWREESMS